MFSKLTKSRSIEDSTTGGSIIGAGVKVNKEVKERKGEKAGCRCREESMSKEDRGGER